MKSLILICCLLFMCISCVQNTPEKEDVILEEEMVEKKGSVASQIATLKADGFQIFDYVDQATGDTVIMQQYFMAFLKSGPNRNQSEEEAAKLQEAHQAHLGRMYELGYADISGPFGDDGDLRGITVYNVPTLKMADSLANLDPMMKAGRLMVEIKPWWAGKGYPLR
ncbi:YciI family protein [uncultured Dokdonia sp.]|uniref:YciI family protein n=1 Tax=uncultured Dokdonia sp. TaxID=575653 RepID=UPI002636AA31|nr:YciI family protein [uncultured Dokdonia sp.]